MGSAIYACPKCGKGIKVSRGSHRDSQRYADYLARRGDLCRDCERQAFQSDHANRIAQAALDPRTALLPALTGSEKEVAWAQALRLNALPKLDAAVELLLAEIRAYETLSSTARQELADAVHLLAEEPRTRESARDWINTRDSDIAVAVNRLLEQRLSTLAPTASVELNAARA